MKLKIRESILNWRVLNQVEFKFKFQKVHLNPQIILKNLEMG